MCAKTISARFKLQQQNQRSETVLSMQLGWPGQRPVQVSLQRQAAWSLLCSCMQVSFNSFSGRREGSQGLANPFEGASTGAPVEPQTSGGQWPGGSGGLPNNSSATPSMASRLTGSGRLERWGRLWPC